MVRGNQNSAYKERNIEFLEEYAQRARQVGLERIDAVRSYQVLELKD